MKVLTIQSKDLFVQNRTYADSKKCNYPYAKPIYDRLFDNYNQRMSTDYKAFFWGFSKLLTDNLDYAVKRATEMIGISLSIYQKEHLMILDVPDNIVLETDFYNFTDEIFAYENPDELSSCWENIYSMRHSEKQVIFPYIDISMIIFSYPLSHFVKMNKLSEIDKTIARKLPKLPAPELFITEGFSPKGGI